MPPAKNLASRKMYDTN